MFKKFLQYLLVLLLSIQNFPVHLIQAEGDEHPNTTISEQQPEVQESEAPQEGESFSADEEGTVEGVENNPQEETTEQSPEVQEEVVLEQSPEPQEEIIIEEIPETPVYYCNKEEHIHSDDCYDIFETLICEEDHLHTDICFQEYRFLVCELEEHLHDEHCEDPNYVEPEEEIDPQVEEEKEIIQKAIAEEENYHLICEHEEHVHTQECFEEISVLICEEDHEHDENCYKQAYRIACEKEEHVHTMECVEHIEEEPVVDEEEVFLSDDEVVQVEETPDEPLLQNRELLAQTLEMARGGLRAAPDFQEPVEADGITLQNVTIKWLSMSSGTDWQARYDDLELVPTNDVVPNQQFQIDFSLSGKGNVPAGSIEIIIPAYIWKTKEGNEPGLLTLAVPEEPSTKQDFAWKRVGDTIVITNAKTIPAAAKYMIQGTFRMTSPDPNATPSVFTSTYAHEMYDIDTTDETAQYRGVSDDLFAVINVETPRLHEVLTMTSNSIRATLNTHVEVANVAKKAVDSKVYMDVPEDMPEELIPENPEDYLYVQWYVSATVNGNQTYDMYLNDTINLVAYNVSKGYDVPVQGILLGASSTFEDTVVSPDGESVRAMLYSGYNMDDEQKADVSSKTGYVWTAFRKADFVEDGVTYRVSNTVTVDVTGHDDEITTTNSATGTASFRMPIIWKVDKVWKDNDNAAGNRPSSLHTWIYDVNEPIPNNYYKIVHNFYLNEENNWHEEWKDDGTITEYKAKEYSWRTNSNTDVIARGYSDWEIQEDGSRCRTAWWYTFNPSETTYNDDTHTYTFTNDYHETQACEGILPWVPDRAVLTTTKQATNHTNRELKATTDRDLSLLSLGQETTEVTYRINSTAIVAPYTLRDGGVLTNPDDYGFKDVEMKVEDQRVSFASLEAFPEGALTEEDYEIRYVYMRNPYLYKKIQYNVWSPWNWQSVEDTVPVELYGKTMNGEWIHYATLDAEGNIETFNGASLENASQKKVRLPENTTHVYTTQKTKRDRITAGYDIGIIFKPSEKLRSFADTLFEVDDYTITNVYNTERTYVYDSEGVEQMSLESGDRAYLHGRNYRLGVDLDKAYIHTETDRDNRFVEFEAIVTLNQQTNITQWSDYNSALRNNELPFSASGVFYDLLPPGMTVDLSTVSMDDGTVISAEAIENYKGSGRVLVIIKAALDDTTTYMTYPRGSVKYNDETYPNEGYYRGNTVRFRTQLTFDEAQNRGLTDLRNTAGYEADESEFGNLRYWGSEPDDPTVGNNKESATAVGPDLIGLMTGLNPSRTENRFVYAQTTARLTEVDFAALTMLRKFVQVTGDEYWTTGHDNDVNVPEAGKYSYEIVLTSGGDTTTKDIILLDSIENYSPMEITDPGESEYNVGDVVSRNEVNRINAELIHEGKAPLQVREVWYWKGYFRSIDVTELEAMGIAPVVYYSTTPNLDISHDAYNPEHDYDAVINKLQDPNGDWTTVLPDDPSTVTAVAIDCRKDENGNDFRLEEYASIIAYIHMQAPTYDQQPDAFAEEDYNNFLNNAHAYNNVYMDITHIDDVGNTTHSYDFYDYTKVGIYSFDLEVEKVWEDDNNRDGTRPDQIEVTLLRNGEPIDRTITLHKDDDYKGKFEYVAMYDGDGRLYDYTVSESGAQDYLSYSFLSGNIFTIRNVHEPERINIPFEKRWTSNEDPGWEINIPNFVVFRLYADGKFTGQRRTVYRGEDGTWKGEFFNLLKYRDEGVEIQYTIEEEVPENFIASYSDDTTLITNTYYPYGDIEAQKIVQNATDLALENEFTFTLSLHDENGEELTRKYAYQIIDVATGDVLQDVPARQGVGHGGQIKLKDGQKFIIKDLPNGTRYQISESSKAGFTLISRVNDSGIVKSLNTNTAEFVNEYSAKGLMNLKGKKGLTGRQIRKYAFRFELLDENHQVLYTSANQEISSSDNTGIQPEPWETNYADINFPSITFTQEDDGREVIYYLREVDRSQAGYTYDPKEIEVHVFPHDNGNGTMSFDYAYYLYDTETGERGEVIQDIEFDNTYEAQGQITLRAWKTLAARKLKNEEFIFDLYDEEGNLIKEAHNVAEGSVTFDPLTFDEKDVGKAFYYYIKERIPSTTDAKYDETVIYDDSTYAYRVHVIDMTNGTLGFNQKTTKPILDDQYQTISIKDGDETIFQFHGEHPTVAWYDHLQTLFEEIEAEYPERVYIKDGHRILVLPDSMSIVIGEKEYVGDLILYHYLDTESGKEYMRLDNREQYLEFKENAGDNFVVTVNSDGSAIGFVDDENAVLPIFHNDLKDGSLSVTKTAIDSESANPNQEFKFRVKFIGENINLDDINIELTNDVAPEEEEEEDTEKAYLDYDAWALQDEYSYYGYPIAEDFKHQDYFKRNTTLTLDEVIALPNVQRIDDGTTSKQIYRWVDDASSTIYWWSDAKKMSLRDPASPESNWNGLFMSSYIANIDVTDFDLSEVTNIRGMFYEAQANITGLETWDVSHVTDMEWLFGYNYTVTSLDLSSWDTSNVQYMASMFSICPNITNIYVSELWSTESVLDGQYNMFTGDELLPNYNTYANHDVTKAHYGEGGYLTYKARPTAAIQTNNNSIAANDSIVDKLLSSFFHTVHAEESDVTTWTHFGTGGNVEWGIDPQGTLWLRPENGASEGTMGAKNTGLSPWNDYRTKIHSVRIKPGTIVYAPRNSQSLFLWIGQEDGVIDLTGFDMSTAELTESMFKGSNVSQLILGDRFDTTNAVEVSRVFSEMRHLEDINLGSLFNTANIDATGSNSGMGNLFAESNQLKKITFPSVFQIIRGGGYWEDESFLPTPPTNETYTGKWIREDGVYGPYTNIEFVQNYTPEMAGTWIWEPTDFVPSTSYYTVQFDLNGAEGEASPIQLRFDLDEQIPPMDLIKEGHLFTGWSDGQGNTYEDGGVIAANTYQGGDTITLTAQFEPAYQIVFDAGTGVGSMPPVFAIVSREFVLPNSHMQKAGNYFSHWLDENDNPYENKATISADSFEAGDVVHLTAQYEPRETVRKISENEYEVTLLVGEKMVFDNIPAGTTYQVYEETPDGWVLVEQSNVSGTIESLTESKAHFVNRFQPGVTSVQFSGTKILDNRPAPEKSFSFELWEGDTLLETVQTLDGGFIQFSVITYEEIGEHTYTIKEKNLGGDRVEYDKHEETVHVVVEENGIGGLRANVTYDSDGIAFVNKTKPGSLLIEKQVDISSANNRDDEFTVKITFQNENGTPLSEDENIYWYKVDAQGNPILTQRPNNLFNFFFKPKEEIEMHSSEIIPQENLEIVDTTEEVTSNETVVEEVVEEPQAEVTPIPESPQSIPQEESNIYEGISITPKVEGNIPEEVVQPEVEKTEVKEHIQQSEENVYTGIGITPKVKTEEDCDECAIKAQTKQSENNPEEGKTSALKLSDMVSSWNPFKVIYAEEFDPDDGVIDIGEEFTVTYDATEEGEFDNGERYNVVKYQRGENILYKYSHTPNVNDEGVRLSNYDNYMSYVDVVTIPGATSLTVTIRGTTESCCDYAQVWRGARPTVSPSGSGSLSGTLRGDFNNTYTIEGDSVTFTFYTDGSVTNYGYYATIHPSNPDTSQEIGEKVFHVVDGEYKEPTYTGPGDKLFTIFTPEFESLTGDATLIATYDNNIIDMGVYEGVLWRIVEMPDGSHKLKLGDENSTQAFDNRERERIVDFEMYDKRPITYPWLNYYNTVEHIEVVGNVIGNGGLPGLFEGFINCTDINVSKFDTSNVTDFSYMFSNLGTDYRKEEFTLDISNFDTRNGVKFDRMFEGSRSYYYDYENQDNSIYYGKINHIEIGDNFVVQNTPDLTGMFNGCKADNIGEIAERIDTSAVTNMSYLFRYIRAQDIDYSRFDTSNVTNMSHMFERYTGESLDLSSFDTSNVTDMSYMFHRTEEDYYYYYDDDGGLFDLNISSFDFSNVTNFNYMFARSSLRTVNMPRIAPNGPNTMDSMFASSAKIDAFNLANIDTSKTTNFDNMFYYTGRKGELKHLDLTTFDTSNAESMAGMLQSTSFDTIDISGWDTSNVINFASFANNTKAKTMTGIEDLNVSAALYLQNFFNYASLENVDVSDWNTANAINMSGIFSNTKNFNTYTGFEEWNTGNVERLDYAFAYSKRETVDLSQWNLEKLKNVAYMFYYSSIDHIDISSMDTRGINMNGTESDNGGSGMFTSSSMYSIKLGPNFSFYGTASPSDYYVPQLPYTHWVNIDTGLHKTSTELKDGYANNAEEWQGTWSREKLVVIYDTKDQSLRFYGTTYEPELTSTQTRYEIFSETNYTEGNIPWYNVRGNIKKVVVEEEVPVYSMQNWFNNFGSVDSWDLTKLDTSKLTNLYRTFYNAKVPSNILQSFDTNSVTTMDSTFYYAKADSIDLSGLDLSNVTDMDNMFRYSTVKSVDFSNTNTPNLRYVSYMFSECTNLEESPFKDINTSNINNLNGVFYGCRKLKEVDFTQNDFSWVTSAENLFNGAGIEYVDFTGSNLVRLTNAKNMFTGNLSDVKERFEIVGLDTKNINIMYSMFSYINVGDDGILDFTWLDGSSATDLEYMFAGVNAAVVDLTGFETPNATKMKYMFQGSGYGYYDEQSYWRSFPTHIGELIIPDLDTRNNPNREKMFFNLNADAVTLGENFLFGPSQSVTNPLYIRNLPYYGNLWMKDDETVGPYTPQEMQENYTGEIAGRYIRLPWYVYFEPNGGVMVGDDYVIGERTTTLLGAADVRNPGHKFLGWATSQENADQGIIDFRANEVITYNGYYYYYYYSQTDHLPSRLYAVWEYDGMNGVVVNHYQESVSGDRYNLVDSDITRNYSGTEVQVSPKDYPGFYLVEGEPEVVIIADDQDILREYYYKRHRYQVNFDGNGADYGQMPQVIDCVGGVSNKLPKNEFTRKGSLFQGWNTEPDGSGISYLDEETILNIANNGDVVTLYAQWQTNENELTPSEGVIYVTLKAGERIMIPDLPYGTTYTIEEVDLPDGWSVGLIAGDTGSIDANVVNQSILNNRYTAQGEAYIQVYKKLEGAALQPGQFTYELLDGNMTVLQTATNGAVDNNPTIPVDDGEIPNPWVGTGMVQFEPLQYTQDDIGNSYRYIVREVNDGDDKVNYDSHLAVIRVDVQDAGQGELKTTVTYYNGIYYYEDQGQLFTNTMKPGTLRIAKNITNATVKASETDFRYRLKLFDAEGNEITGTYKAIRKHADYQPGDEDKMVTKVSHTPNYSDDGTRNGNYYNNMNQVETVTIPGASSIEVKVQYYTESCCDYLNLWKGTQVGDTSGCTIYYSYYYGSSQGECNDPTFITTLRGGRAEYTTVVEGDSVTFNFRTDSSVTYDGYFATVTGVGAKTFDNIRITTNEIFTLKGGETIEINDLPHGVTYELEELPEQGWELYDFSNTTGEIAANEIANASFTNIYSTTGGITVEADKNFHGGTISDKTFTFELTDENGNVISEATSDENGHVKFTSISYDQDDDGMTYTYYIREVKDASDTEVDEWDDHLLEVNVKITDDGKGHLDTEVTYDQEDIEFHNFILRSLSVEKEITGTMGDKEDIFNFTLQLSGDYASHPITFRKTYYDGSEETGEVNRNPFNFTLGHKDKILFEGIVKGVTYEVVEVDSNRRGYETTAEGGDVHTHFITRRVSVTGEVEDESQVKFTNDRNAVVPVGVKDNWPLTLLIIPPIIYFVIKGRRKKEDEDE